VKGRCPVLYTKVLPEHFYASHKQWEITLNKVSTYDFVRQYCLLGSPRFVVDVGAGKKTKLQRYVSPTVWPPDINLTANFKTAIAKHPTSPAMPDTTSMQCMYLEDVNPVE